MRKQTVRLIGISCVALALIGAAEPQWVWPVQQAVILRGFDPPDQRWLPGHRGVDIAGLPNESIAAIGGGVVSFAGQVGGRPVVAVRHGRIRSTYEPVDGTVAVGTSVQAGQQIGTLRSGHCGPGTWCLHLGLRRGEQYLDPRAVLQRAFLKSSSGSPARG
jgi:murein DD-endopeptidase MepM/ murein hydrolase activator NlpD